MSIPTYVRSALSRMCEEVASPVANQVKYHLENDRWDQLAVMRVDPHSYSNAHQYFLDACCVDFLRKTEDLPTTFDRKAVAVEGFWKTERECFVANRFLDRFLISDSLEQDFGRAGSMVEFMRKTLRELLGPCPSVVDGRFGPGATYGDKGQHSLLPDKMSSHPTFTRSAVFSLVPWSSTKWARVCAERDKHAECIRGNRFTTVPKDCLKDRGICVEPSINLFFQLGFGSALKKRLARSGLDLIKSQDIHRQVACDASKTGAFATIDLSNASDTICSNLVKLLLPNDWFVQLDDLRSHYTNVDGRWVLLEKFSSMGNGFTFELETAIFLTICQGAAFLLNLPPLCPNKDVWCFGDDIIVPTEVAPCVLKLLRYFGLTPNEKKTFVEGPFRESCGGDFFNGVAVRPYFLKEFPNEPQEYIAVANGIRRLGSDDRDADIHSGLFLRSWFSILDAIPSNIRRCRGPVHLGDLVIHDVPEKWSCRKRNSIRYFRVYRPHRYRMVPWRKWCPDVVLACALYGAASNERREAPSKDKPRIVEGGVIPRDSVRSYKLGWTPMS